MDARFCDELDHGFSWIVDEPATRASHALTAGGRVWLVDPTAWEPALERARAAGRPAAVLQLLDRHNRDCAALARRLGVPHLVAPARVPDGPFQVVEIRRSRRWQEVALWWPETRTLVVAEALGTNRFFSPDGSAGVHLLLRLRPPRAALAGLEPRHLLVGHGAGIHGEAATAALREALARSRTDLPRALLQLPRWHSTPAGGGDAESATTGRGPAQRAARANPGRTRRGGAFSPASATGGLTGSASGSAPKDARRRSSGTGS